MTICPLKVSQNFVFGSILSSYAGNVESPLTMAPHIRQVEPSLIPTYHEQWALASEVEIGFLGMEKLIVIQTLSKDWYDQGLKVKRKAEDDFIAF